MEQQQQNILSLFALAAEFKKNTLSSTETVHKLFHKQ